MCIRDSFRIVIHRRATEVDRGFFTRLSPRWGNTTPLSLVTDKIVFITDREKVIAAAGDGLKGIVGKEISHSLERILDDRDESLPLAERSRFIPVVEGMGGADEMKKIEQVRQMIRSNGPVS